MDGVALDTVQANAKKMMRREGTWTRPDTRVCSIAIAEPAGAADGALAATFEVPASLKGKVLAANGALRDGLRLRPHDHGHLLIVALPGSSAPLDGSLSQSDFCRLRCLLPHTLRAGLLDEHDARLAASAAVCVDDT